MKWVGNVIVFLSFIIATFALVAILKTKDNPEAIPSIFGYKMMNILTGSMEPNLNPGDIAVIKDTDPKSILVGDIITFVTEGNIPVTHRVFDIQMQDEVPFFVTKGDANNMHDQDLVSPDNLIGGLSFHIPKAGYIANFIKSPIGLSIVIGIILFSFTIRVLRRFIFEPEQKSTT